MLESAPRSRKSPTLPPPPVAHQASDRRARAAELRAAAIRILAQAEELEESADRIEGSEHR